MKEMGKLPIAIKTETQKAHKKALENKLEYLEKNIESLQRPKKIWIRQQDGGMASSSSLSSSLTDGHSMSTSTTTWKTGGGGRDTVAPPSSRQPATDHEASENILNWIGGGGKGKHH